MFLGESREDKIRLRNREKSAVGLRALTAPKAPRPYGDLGLLNLIPRSLRIEFRIDKAGQPLFLIRLQDMDPWDQEHRSDRHHSQKTDRQSLLPLQATQK